MTQNRIKDLERLTSDIAKHPALNNAFYSNWRDRKFRIEELQIFQRNYGEFVKSFPKTLAVLFANLDDSAAQTEIASTLNSEMGYGNPEKTHWKLLDVFMNDLALHLGHKGKLERDYLANGVQLSPTTTELIEGERKLYSNSDPRIAVGAQLALEWQAYHMLSKLHEGAQKNYSHLWPSRVDFDKSAEYFLIHLIAEKDHEIESLEAAAQYAINDGDVMKITLGFNQHLDLMFAFWNDLYEGIQKC